MFESLEDAAVVDAIRSAACAENAACGRRLMAIPELYARRAPEEDAERINWAIDGHANVVAEISAALNISRGRAAGQLRYAIDLRERLPKVAKVFATGAIDFRMMAELVNRGANVTDPDLLANLDAAFAQWAPTWMKMSGPTLTERIDMWVAKFDPTGVREPRPVREDRYVEIGPISPGMAGIWAKLPLHEGAAFDTRLDDIAATVCHHDPRTTAQRRADALGAIAAGQTRLACGCGHPECPAAAPLPPSAQVVIEVIADHSSLEGSSQNPGYLPGFGAVPAPMLREMAATAQLRPVPLPVCQPGYRPSTALARFIRCRDLTCRFPGCDAPAQVCDIDHTIPYPLGPTHPSNLKLLCRFQHRMIPYRASSQVVYFLPSRLQGAIRMFDCEAVDLDFLNAAPVRLDTTVHVGRPPSEVFAALAHNPAAWGEFFPGFDRTGRYHTPVPHGVDSRRTARFAGARFEETILAWDEGARWAFRVDSTQAPLFDACIEDYHFDADGSDATLLCWTLAYKPRLAFKLARPLLPSFLTFALTRAGHNLENGRWFSTPTPDS